ncbi:fungal-specific transcription factor domain-containing protein [Lentinula aciculospora]|uniref:Fungal-specific transcription factor domain-containing protein n=1 Tax=Lentinula aciculospora TaxID=153920 RepID=A0A9W9AW77_9AGAR|nr:fungal-specific transcription factor domain-containing protein [Lentinula aciculospora]
MSFKNESSANFHSFPQMSFQEKTDIRRVQGQISCAECRRLKLKCDKKIPCSSCVKRGCSSFCPTKTLTPLPTKRIMTSDTAALHKKIQTMSQRIKQLEDALSTLQSTVSSEPHHLLVEAPPRMEPRKNSLTDDAKTAQMADALGTLTLGKLGDARYLGRSAGSESLLEGSPEVQGTVDEEDFIPSNDIAQLVNSFPFAPDSTWDVESSMKLILSYLPEKDRAWSLAEGFLTHNFWYIKIISREELIDELLTPMYRSLNALDALIIDSAATFTLSPTRLAVLLICLAHGSLADLSMPMYSAESALFFNLSRASLALHPVFVSPDLATVQALTLIGSYYDTGGPNYSIEAGWVYLTIAAKLTHSLGLHRESPRWGLDEKTIQRRRATFWELYTFDGLTSLALGRPPSLFTAHGDTPLPVDKDDGVDDQGNPEPGFHRWRMTFSRDVITAVANVTLSPGMPDYETILDLDRLVREHPLPQKYDPVRSMSTALEKNSTRMNEEEEHVGYEASLNALKGHHLTQFRAVVVMHVHRAFFAQALLQSPSDPLGSVYAPSFLAAYRTASTMIHLNVKHFYKYSNVLSRYWEIWTGILSAGIILGLIVARSPTSPIAANAYAELGLAVDLFKMGAPRSDRAKRGLNVLLRMYEKATKSYLSTNSQEYMAKDKMNVMQEDADALHTLETFAGYTKILMKEMRSSRRDTENLSSDSGSPEASGQYQSEHSTESKYIFSDDIYTDNLHSSQTTNYSFSSSSSSSAAVKSPDRIPLSQSPSDSILPVDRGPYLGYVSTVSTSPPSMPSYSFERGEPNVTGIPSSFGYGVGPSRDMSTDPARYSSSARFATQRDYWNDSHSSSPVLHEGNYGGSSWTSIQPGGSNPPIHPGINQGSYDWGHTEQGAFGRPANQNPFTMSVGAMDAQWAELMRDEGVYNAGISSDDFAYDQPSGSKRVFM